MKIQKKFIAILLIATILSSLIPSLISNAVEPNYTINLAGTNETSTAVNVGDEIKVDLNFSNGPANQKVLAIGVNYDCTALSLKEDKLTDAGEKQLQLGRNKSLNSAILGEGYELAMGGATEIDGKGNANITYVASDDGVDTSGRAATLTFIALKPGTTKITYDFVSYSETTDTDAVASYPASSFTVNVNTPPVPMTSFSIAPKSANIDLSTTTKSVKLTASYQPEDTTDSKDVKWTSSNPGVATVSSDGTVTGISAGTTTITATCGKFTDTSVITVKNPLTGITLDKDSITINKNEDAQLVASLVPSNADGDNKIVWETSDATVATVANGIVHAVGKGTATITAKCGEFSKTCTVTVVVPLTGLTLNKTEVEIDRNSQIQLTATKNPVDTTETETKVIWTSDDETVASVDNNGLVTGNSIGETIIKAQIGTFTAMCKVKVNVHIESIEIVGGDVQLDPTQTKELNIKYNPTEFSDSKTIIWSSSDTSVATIENGVVKAIAPGTTTITAKTVNKNEELVKTATIKVTVNEIKADKVVINKNETTIEKGNTETLTATVLPENTTDSKEIVWASSDENIATVKDGIVTAVAPGTVTITAKCGELEPATCEVTVICALQSISLSETEIKIEAGETSEALVVTKNPTDATVNVEDVVWTSENEEVATIKDGIVTAVAPGTAVIKATLDGKVATCEVKVIVTLTSVEIENGEDTLELIKGQTSELKTIYTPENATEIPEAKWTSSDETVVTVDNNGNVKAVAEGTATITVDYGNGISATRNVKVKEIHAETVVIDQVVETLNKNQSIKLNAKVEPEDSTDTITWTSSDATIATVDNEGNVKALKAGKVTLTATASNGKFASMEIEIKEVTLESIEVNVKDGKITEGDTTQIDVKFNPKDVTDDIVISYETSDSSIATVDKNGKITAKKAGNAIITVYAEAKQGDGTTNTVKSQVKLTINEKESSKDNVTSGTQSSGGQASSVAAAQQVVQGLTTSPHTGDMNIALLAIMMVISLAGMIITIKKK